MHIFGTMTPSYRHQQRCCVPLQPLPNVGKKPLKPPDKISGLVAAKSPAKRIFLFFFNQFHMSITLLILDHHSCLLVSINSCITGHLLDPLLASSWIQEHHKSVSLLLPSIFLAMCPSASLNISVKPSAWDTPGPCLPLGTCTDAVFPQGHYFTTL